MKTTTFLCAMMLTISAYGTKVPDAVEKAFKDKFPTATNIKWEKEGRHEFEAEFMIGKQAASANFTNKGEWLTTEMELPAADIPERIVKAFKTFAGDCKIDIAKVEEVTDKSGKLKYEIEYKVGRKTKEVVFDDEGNKLK